jgi:hypothetical protein
MKKLWKYLKGKKRIIGLAMLIVNSGLQAFAPDLLTPPMYNWISLVGGAIGGVGVWDAKKQKLVKTPK